MIPIITPQVMLEEEKIWSIQDPLERINVSSQALFEALLPLINPETTLLFIVGKGLNGADTLALACLCFEAGFNVRCFSLFNKTQAKAETSHFFDKASAYNLIGEFNLPDQGRFVIFDGLFGAGFKGPLDQHVQSIIEQINKTPFYKIAIDIPSGIDGESGEGLLAIEADITLSIGLPKWGLFVKQGRYHSGHIYHVDIGLKKTIAQQKALGFFLRSEELEHLLPHEKPYFHKYERGQVLKMAACPMYKGASFLSTKAAYRAGAGIVRVVHDDQNPFFEHLAPEVTQCYKKDLKPLLEKKNTALIIGPGLEANSISDVLTESLMKTKLPAVIDGGAFIDLKIHLLHSHLVLTPHLSELQNVLKLKTNDFDEIVKHSSNDLLKSGLTLVIKGHHTWIMHQDHRPVISSSAPLAAATAGSGDVLSGIIATFLAKNLAPLDATCLAVGLHSLAASLACLKKSKKAILASDIIEALPEALEDLLIGF